jgi:hypothetical protein
MSSLEVASALARRGMHVFPVDHPELLYCAGVATRSHNPKTCNQRGKHPAVSFSSESTTDPLKIAAWFTGSPRNVGIHCGPSKLFVVDEDQLGEFDRYAAEHRVTIPPTMVVTTAKGRHFYFTACEDHPLTNAEGAFRSYNINIRAGNGYVVAPGSLHDTGVIYSIAVDRPAVPIPSWLVAAVKERPTVEANGNGSPARGLDALPLVIRGPRTDSGGERHSRLVSYAGRLRALSLTRAEAEPLYRQVWERCEQPPTCTTPMTWAEALAKLDDVYGRYAEGRPVGNLHELTPSDQPPIDQGRRRVVLTSAADIKPRRVRWLWYSRLALGTLALLAGREGIGKSTVAYDRAAKITKGELPGEFQGQPKAVLVAATEDSWEHTIVPRLIAHGADRSKVFQVEVLEEDVHTGLVLPKDVKAVQDAAAEKDAVLLILDPIMSRIDDRLDTHKDAEVRRALEPLAGMAHTAGLCVWGIIHHNKGSSADPLNAVMGSRAFTGVARSVHTVVKDPDDGDRRLYGTPKKTLAGPTYQR